MVEFADRNTLAIAASEGSFRKITIEELNNLGYEITGTQMPMGERPYRYGLLELMNEGENCKDKMRQELNFCYLYSLVEQTGVILPHKFKHYLKKKK
jgi:hypothetical protein